jgi:hypothetical protein
MLLKMQVSGVSFIPPALPRLRPSPPAGDGWLFELKFDGWRAQLHKAGVYTDRKRGGMRAILGYPTQKLEAVARSS